MQIPGVEGKDLDIQVTREAVAITDEHRNETKAENGGYVRSKFRYGKFKRVISLPVAIQNDKVQTEYKHGILTLILPKITEARQQVIKINLTKNIAEPVSEATHIQKAQVA
ncbi:Hsp20/alpha crystallin family protein [Fischerella sp. PCC 9605]|uniref:Hsp20/alpha crystallin family protein n=1 Tax=Fischerella sp. PCC 9605 TaxID=1173024 RepID=UPI0004AE91A1|nr:Hsp20/alpha crystallin family protein [Fischerella sp. PCC 9605]